MKQVPPLSVAAWAVIENSLDRADPDLPKFRRFETAVRTAILEGKLPPGTRLPPEKQVAEYFDLSLGTAQRAMTSLERDGYVVRARRRGTFVAARHVMPDEVYIFRFKDPETGALLPPLVRILAVADEDDNGPWRDFLFATRITRIERLMRVGTEPAVYSEFFVDERHGACLMGKALDEIKSLSLHRFLADEFALPTIRVEHRLQGTVFPAAVCDHLLLPTGSCGMLWEIAGYSHEDRPTSYQRIYLPAGHRPVEFDNRI